MLGQGKGDADGLLDTNSVERSCRGRRRWANSQGRASRLGDGGGGTGVVGKERRNRRESGGFRGAGVDFGRWGGRRGTMGPEVFRMGGVRRAAKTAPEGVMLAALRRDRPVRAPTPVKAARTSAPAKSGGGKKGGEVWTPAMKDRSSGVTVVWGEGGEGWGSGTAGPRRRGGSGRRRPAEVEAKVRRGRSGGWVWDFGKMNSGGLFVREKRRTEEEILRRRIGEGEREREGICLIGRKGIRERGREGLERGRD